MLALTIDLQNMLFEAFEGCSRPDRGGDRSGHL
jgi:hypothetical protein